MADAITGKQVDPFNDSDIEDNPDFVNDSDLDEDEDIDIDVV